MSSLKTVISVICISLILHGLLCLLIPEGSIKKSLIKAMSLSLIASIVISLKGVDFNFSDFYLTNNTSKINANEVSSEVLNYKMGVTEKSLENLIANEVSQITDNEFSVDVLTDISSDSNISINRVLIKCHEEDIENITSIVEKIGIEHLIVEGVG